MPFRKYKPKRFTKKKWTPKYTKKKTFRRATKFSRKRTYVKNKSMAKGMKTMVETKKILGTPILTDIPRTTWSLAGVNPSNVFQLEYDYANAAASSPFGQALNCTNVVQGITANQRIGNYVYFKNIQGALRISMETGLAAVSPELRQPIRFRCIWFKNKRVYSPVGAVSDPARAMFLDPIGNAFGPESGIVTQTMTPLQFFTAPFNLRHFKIGTVKEFTLGPPVNLANPIGAAVAYSQSNSNLKTHKIIKFNLPIWQKCKFDVGNRVEDRDVHWRLMVLAMPTGGGVVGPADQWRLSMDSVGLYNDV